MLHHYADIRDLICIAPKWWDEHGVPRYCEFAPDQCANVYADEAALVEITCQDCGTEFLVAFTSSRFDERPVSDEIRSARLHYGDPPNAGCCAAGPTMNCDDRRVLQFWSRESFDWTRDAALEISLEQDGPSPLTPSTP